MHKMYIIHVHIQIFARLCVLYFSDAWSWSSLACLEVGEPGVIVHIVGLRVCACVCVSE